MTDAPRHPDDDFEPAIMGGAGVPAWMNRSTSIRHLDLPADSLATREQRDLVRRLLGTLSAANAPTAPTGFGVAVPAARPRQRLFMDFAPVLSTVVGLSALGAAAPFVSGALFISLGYIAVGSVAAVALAQIYRRTH